jgi:hypothetical protein
VEFTAVLMKLHFGVTSVFLSDLLNILAGSFSVIVNTWMKFLANELRPLIYWPAQSTIWLLRIRVSRKYPTL